LTRLAGESMASMSSPPAAVKLVIGPAAGGAGVGGTCLHAVPSKLHVSLSGHGRT
jgi:hypothetical protein